ncbi:hypothetical protein [Epibacterium sp. Ofav1-8]|uniref:hypothetical protein n=1 Tax=Epibacterium sp. Ofav1-8 TaxID=2917735 RepID=UPI001EF4FC41|nr:hypothetical protein [Epibacterium sp. Ofav1-8]
MFVSPSRIAVALALGMSLSSGAPLSAADTERFDSYTQGRTIHFDWQGQPYGAERYLPGQRVIWSFLDGRCIEGEWYMQAGDICFVYEDRPDAQCWSYQIDDSGLSVTIERGSGPALTLTEQKRPRDEMVCLGPEVGV